MRNPIVISSMDITNESYNRAVTCDSDDPAVWYRTHVADCFLSALRSLFYDPDCGLKFPLDLHCELSVLRENLNAQFRLTVTVKEGDQSIMEIAKDVPVWRRPHWNDEQ